MASIDRAFATLTAFSSVIGLSIVLYFAPHGFDFTDEGFYLQWISNPWNSNFHAPQFGFLLNPIYRIFNGDIVLLRILNVLFTFLLGLAASLSVLSTTEGKLNSTASQRWIYSISVAIGVFAIFRVWLLTPNYNSLNLYSLLLITIGVFQVHKGGTVRMVSGSALVGCSLWIILMAKLSTLVILCLLLFLLLLLVFNRSWSKIAFTSLSAVAVSAILTLLYVGGGPLKFAERIERGIETSKLLDAQHSLADVFRVDRLRLDTLEWRGVALLVLVFMVSLWGALQKNKRHSNLKNFLPGLGILVLGTGVLSGFLTLSSYIFVAFLFLTVLAGAMIHFSSTSPFRRHQLAFAAFLTLMPYAYTFGTGNIYWDVACFVGFFWVLALSYLLNEKGFLFSQNRIWLVVAVFVQGITASILFTSLAAPYRQGEPLWRSASEIVVVKSTTPLIVSGEISRYLSEIRSKLGGNGFSEELPVIDLTGHAPGVVFAAGGKLLGAPWIVGGYKGSEALARGLLAYSDCEDLAAAWILTEPTGPLAIQTSVLNVIGFDFEKDYEIVASLQTPIAQFDKAYQQNILRPLKSDLLEDKCRRARQQNPG